jgi:hypothetical protein
MMKFLLLVVFRIYFFLQQHRNRFSWDSVFSPTMARAARISRVTAGRLYDVTEGLLQRVKKLIADRTVFVVPWALPVARY